MSEHKARVSWHLSGGDFRNGKYSREHSWTFDGGVSIPASPAPSVVPVPLSNPAGVDPEEAFVAAIASCHMLTFLYLAYREGLDIRSYEDDAVGTMTRGENEVPWVSSVVLRPRIEFGGDSEPDVEVVQRLHHAAHGACYIANSVKTNIVVDRPA